MKKIFFVWVFLFFMVSQPTVSQLSNEEYTYIHRFDSLELNGIIQNYLLDYHHILTQKECDSIVVEVQNLLIQYFAEEEMMLLNPPEIAITKYHNNKAVSYVLEVNIKVGEQLGNDTLIVIYTTGFLIYKYYSADVIFTRSCVSMEGC